MDPLAHLPGPGRARVLVDGLDHPEGVAYDPARGVLYAGGEAGQIYRIGLPADEIGGSPADEIVRTTGDEIGGSPADEIVRSTAVGAEEVARAPGFVLGLAVDGRGRLAVCVSSDGSLCAYDGERVQCVATGLTFPNWPAFAPDGSLYVSDSGTWTRNDGRLVRIDADGTAETFSRAVPHFTNGCAVTPDGEWLWVVESFEPIVSRFELATGRREEVTTVYGTVLDGLAFTADGGALISCYRPDRIYHLDSAGHLETVAQDPQGTLLSAPTNVCFAGDRVVAANLGRWHLTLLDLGLRGAELHRPERWALDTLAVAV
jgi:gluconolactonase